MSSFFLLAGGYSRYHDRCSDALFVRQYWGCAWCGEFEELMRTHLCPLSDSLEKQVVTVQLNGELREVPEGLTLAALIEWLKLPRDRVAVEQNLEIVPRARWNVTPIQAGDQLEVVHLVGGGMEGRDFCLPSGLGHPQRVAT